MVRQLGSILVTLHASLFFSPVFLQSHLLCCDWPIAYTTQQFTNCTARMLEIEFPTNHSAGGGISRNMCGINSVRLVAHYGLHTQHRAHMWNYCSFITTVFVPLRRITYLSRHLQLNRQLVPIQIPPPDLTVEHCRQPSRRASNIL